ncbi:MAG: hypothetical protein J3R72DRAFT_528047 [Linnemannia gamsii]|nr:MAG: hypothetical protein J3R72DRAFT_528047 [Linnemannia gamsii]
MSQGFFDIPELVSLLSLYLHPMDLLSCIQVNHTWNRLFTPSLWQTIDDSTGIWVDILQETPQRDTPICPSTLASEKKARNDWLFSIFAKYGHHIQHLKIRFLIILQAASEGGTCKGLKSLVVEHRGYGEGNPELWYIPSPYRLTLPALTNQGQIVQAGGLIGAAPADAAAVGGFGAVPAAPFGGFGTYPVAGRLGGFGQGILPEPPSLTVELSEPKFPDIITAADVLNESKSSRFTEESRKAVAEYEWINTQHLWHLVRSNPGLTRFDTYMRGDVGLYRALADNVYSTLHILKNLKVLDGRSRFYRINFWTLLECLPEGIESLSVDCDVFPLPDPLPEPRSSLLVLETMGSPTISGLLTLLEVFPNLTHLRVREVRSNPSEPWESSFIPLSSSLRSGGRSLRNFDCFMCCDWSTLLRLIPSIVEWNGVRSLRVGEATVLEELFGPRLESFRTTLHPSSDGYPDSRPHYDPTNQFLVTHPNLREFDSIENLIKVDEMLRQPWACMGLERLTCRIVGVDRLNKGEEAVVAKVMAPGYLNELTEEDTRAVEKFHRCRAQHHGVYDRLASLTRLKHLNLGYENRNTGSACDRACYTGENGVQYVKYAEPMFDTLEMSLESGLDRLGVLRSLEMIGFECINHRIGRAELDWMAKSWPKLRLMYGLEKERLCMIEYDKNRTALRKYFKRLRPDVVHDSLFKVKI